MLSDRFFALKASISEVYSRIIHDEILQTLAKNAFSQDHFPDRVKEVFAEVIENDREAYLSVVLEEKDRLSLENTRNLEKIANLLKEIAIKEGKMKQNIEKYEEIMRINRTLESKNRENEGLLAKNLKDEEELMRISAEIATLKVRLKEKDRLFEEISQEKDLLLADNIDKEKSLRFFSEKEKSLEKALLELESIHMALKRDLEKYKEKADFLTKKLEFEEKSHIEKLENSIETKMQAFDEKIARKDEEIEALKKGISDFSMKFEEKITVYKMKKEKYKENMRVFEKTVREYEGIIEEKRRNIEDFMKKIEDFQGLISKLEGIIEENKENYRKDLEELRKNHKISLDKAISEENKRNFEVLKLKEEKEEILRKLDEGKRENLEKIREKTEEKKDFIEKIKDIEKARDFFKENIEKLALENEILVKSNKSLEMELFKEKRENEAKIHQIQGILKEKALEIDSLEANLKIYKENEEFLRKKGDYQENMMNKRKNEFEVEIKKLKENLEAEKNNFMKKNKEFITKIDEFSKEKEAILKEKSQENRRFERIINEKDEVIEEFRVNHEEMKRKEEESAEDLRDFERKIEEFTRETKDFNEKVIEKEKIKEKTIISLENEKNSLEIAKIKLNNEITDLNHILSEQNTSNSIISNEFHEFKQKTTQKVLNYREEISNYSCFLRNELKEIKRLHSGLIHEILQTAELYFKDFMRVSNEISEKKDLILQEKYQENIKALESRKNNEILRNERNFIENRLNPLEKSLCIEKALRFEAETLLNQRNRELSIINTRFSELQEEFSNKIAELSIEKDDKIKDFKTFEAKLLEKDKEIIRKNQEISLISGFLVKIKDEVLRIMAFERKKQKKHKKDLENLNENIRETQTFHQKALMNLKKEILILAEQNHNEIEDFQREITIKKQALDISEQKYEKSQQELEAKESIIEKLKEKLENLTEKTSNLQAELEEKNSFIIETRSFHIKEKKPNRLELETQRKLTLLQKDLNLKIGDLAKITQENATLNQTIKTLEMQVKLKTMNYEKLKEENVIENMKGMEDLKVWKRLVEKKQNEKTKKSNYFRREEEILTKQVKDLQNIEKSFNV